jgi:hypothetical protein
LSIRLRSWQGSFRDDAAAHVDELGGTLQIPTGSRRNGVDHSLDQSDETISPDMDGGCPVCLLDKGQPGRHKSRNITAIMTFQYSHRL